MIYRNGRYYDRMVRNGVTYDRAVRNGVVYGQPPTPPQGYTINLTLSGTPTSITFADLKYNKKCVFQQDWDDNAMTALDGLTKFNGLAFDDGTGKSINWRGSLAVMGRSNFNNAEIGAAPGAYITYAQMQTLIASGWDICNHAMYGTDSGNFNNGGDLEWDLTSLVEMIELNTGYPITCIINPGSITGYSTAGAATGHIVNTGTNSEPADTFPRLPDAGWMPATDIMTWPQGFKYLMREFTDTWSDISYLQGKIDAMYSASNGAVHKLFRIGTHDSSAAGFNTIMDYINAGDSGNLWMCSMRELIEYLKVRDESVITVNGNTVIVELPEDLRWEDFTLLVEGATVTGATSPDADDITFSSDMVNFYKDNFA